MPSSITFNADDFGLGSESCDCPADITKDIDLHFEHGIYENNTELATKIRANRDVELERFYQRNYFSQRKGTRIMILTLLWNLRFARVTYFKVPKSIITLTILRFPGNELLSQIATLNE